MRNKIKSSGDRITAITILLVMTFVALGTTMGIGYLNRYNFYNDNGAFAWETGRSLACEDKFEELEQIYYRCLLSDFTYDKSGKPVAPVLGNGYDVEGNLTSSSLSEKALLSYSRKKCNFAFCLKDSSGKVLWYNYDLPSADGTPAFAGEGNAIAGTAVCQYAPSRAHIYYVNGAEVQVTEDIFVLEESAWQARDSFSMIKWWVDFAAACKYIVFAVVIISAAIAFSVMTMLTISSGTEGEDGEIRADFFDSIPLDVLTLLSIGVCCVAGICMRLTIIANAGIVTNNAVMIVSAGVIMLILTLYLSSLSTRIKIGKIYKNTLFYRVFVLTKRKSPQKFRKKFKKLSFLTKSILLISGLVLVSMSFLAYFAYRYFVLGPEEMRFEYFMIIWIASRLIVIPILLMLAVNFDRVKSAGRKLADGDLADDPRSGIQVRALRSHSENLEHVRQEMARALDQEMKEEHYRNELISNLSHDLRTPLTSIITYADFLKKPGLTEEERQEYLDVLTRQAERLSALTKDLTEISKYTTGSVAPNLEKTDAGILLDMISGEYYYLLKAAGIEPEFEKEDREYPIMADADLMSRVVSNLVKNIEKYALSGTRAYFRVKELDGKIVMSFRNITGKIPEVPVEELVGRTVRGDSSRHEEGSGLGLSIAKSLTEVQHGEFGIELDGDIFTVTIKFEKAR